MGFVSQFALNYIVQFKNSPLLPSHPPPSPPNNSNNNSNNNNNNDGKCGRKRREEATDSVRWKPWGRQDSNKITYRYKYKYFGFKKKYIRERERGSACGLASINVQLPLESHSAIIRHPESASSQAESSGIMRNYADWPQVNTRMPAEASYSYLYSRSC